MTTKLDRLLEQLDPDRTINETAARCDQALSSLYADAAPPQDWDEFKTWMARVFRHCENEVLRLTPPLAVDPNADWGRCADLLRQEYGPKGEFNAFQAARLGLEGGVHAVMKAVAKRMAEDYADNQTACCVGEFFSELSLEEKLAVPDEYIDKYGHLIPADMLEGRAARIRGNFLEVLKQHPRVIRQMRNTGR